MFGDVIGVGARALVGFKTSLISRHFILPAALVDLGVIIAAAGPASLAAGMAWPRSLQLATTTFACFVALVLLLRSAGVAAPNHSYRQIFTVVLAWSLSCLVVMTVAEAGGGEIGADAAADFILAGLAGLVTWRLALKAWVALAGDAPVPARRRMVVVGRHDRAAAAMPRLIASGDMVDTLVTYGAEDPVEEIHRLATRALALAADRGADGIVIAAGWRDAGALEIMVDALRGAPIRIELASERGIFPVRFGRQGAGTEIAIGDLRNGALSRSQVLAKRAFDILAASLGLLVLLPLLIAIAIGIRLTSPGPVLFRQIRNGLGGRPFLIYKFRTMTVLEDGDAVRQATRGDRRITPLGRFLRRTSLDELPQLWNVLKGDMSVVGPRPHASAVNDDYQAQITGYSFRHDMKPGLTGWAQVNGWRGTMTLDSMKSRIEHDLHYIDHWSVLLDLYIVLLTLKLPFRDRAAF